MKVSIFWHILVLRLEITIMDPNAYFLFKIVLTGNSLKNIMFLTQTFVIHLLKVCYIYQSTR